MRRATPKTSRCRTGNNGVSMTRIGEWWWKLETEFNERKLVFFGQTEGEVLGKYRAYIRRWELEKVR